jgi:hypothetical protein
MKARWKLIHLLFYVPDDSLVNGFEPVHLHSGIADVRFLFVVICFFDHRLRFWDSPNAGDVLGSGNGFACVPACMTWFVLLLGRACVCIFCAAQGMVVLTKGVRIASHSVHVMGLIVAFAFGGEFLSFVLPDAVALLCFWAVVKCEVKWRVLHLCVKMRGRKALVICGSCHKRDFCDYLAVERTVRSLIEKGIRRKNITVVFDPSPLTTAPDLEEEHYIHSARAGGEILERFRGLGVNVVECAFTGVDLCSVLDKVTRGAKKLLIVFVNHTGTSAGLGLPKGELSVGCLKSLVSEYLNKASLDVLFVICAGSAGEFIRSVCDGGVSPWEGVSFVTSTPGRGGVPDDTVCAVR